MFLNSPSIIRHYNGEIVKVVPLCQPCLFSQSLSEVKVVQNSYNNQAHIVI
jgi:hypothetical protein